MLCDAENGIIEWGKLLEKTKDKINFTYVRLMGDNHNVMSTEKVKVTQAGFEAMME